MTDQELIDLVALAESEGLTSRQILSYNGQNDPSRADIVAMTRRLTLLCEARQVVWKYSEAGATKIYYAPQFATGRWHACEKEEEEQEKPAPSPLPTKADFAPHAVRMERKSEVPAYLKGFRGIQATVEREPDYFESVIQVSFSHDGTHFDPIRLSEATIIRVGEAIPHWFTPSSCVALTNIHALSVKYRKGSDIVEVLYTFPHPYTLFYGEQK